MIFDEVDRGVGGAVASAIGERLARLAAQSQGLVVSHRPQGAARASHPDVAMISLSGSVQAGRAVMKAGADTIKPVLLELGGKNALIARADADPDEVAAAVVAGMNFTWCGQSCGSTSRGFLYKATPQPVVERLTRNTM